MFISYTFSLNYK